MDSPYPKEGTWASIPGFSGYIGSLDAQIYDLRRGRLKKQRKAGNGSMQVDIGKTTCMVHDLIARAFHGHPLCKGYRVKFVAGKSAHETNLVWSGKPDGSQSPRYDHNFEVEYQRIRRERESLAELMQS